MHVDCIYIMKRNNLKIDTWSEYNKCQQPVWGLDAKTSPFPSFINTKNLSQSTLHEIVYKVKKTGNVDFP